MRRVQLDQVESDARRARGGDRERIAQVLHLILAERGAIVMSNRDAIVALMS